MSVITLSRNRLLAALPAQDLESLHPHLRHIEMLRDAVLMTTGREITRAYFPHSGIISLAVNMEQGELVEVAMIGRDSVLGASAALGDPTSLNVATVRAVGTASTIEIAQLRTVANQSLAVRTILYRHEQALFSQAQQGAACNATHSVERRLSRWLLRMRDLSDSDSLLITQDFLAQLLGVQRNSVSLVAHELQLANLIRYSRGHIEVINAKGLLRSTCKCYKAVNQHYERLVGCNDKA